MGYQLGRTNAISQENLKQTYIGEVLYLEFEEHLTSLDVTYQPFGRSGSYSTYEIKPQPNGSG